MVRSTFLIFPVISEKSSLESANESVDGKPRKSKKFISLQNVFGRSTLQIDSRLYLEASLQAIQMLKCSSKRFVEFAPCWSKRCSPRSQKTSESALLAFSDAFRCDSQKFRRAAAQKQIFIHGAKHSPCISHNFWKIFVGICQRVCRRET